MLERLTINPYIVTFFFLLLSSSFFSPVKGEKKKKKAEETKCSAASERLDRCRVVSVRVRACVRAFRKEMRVSFFFFFNGVRSSSTTLSRVLSLEASRSLSLSLSLMKRSSAVSSAVSSHFFLLFFLFFSFDSDEIKSMMLRVTRHVLYSHSRQELTREELTRIPRNASGGTW